MHKFTRIYLHVNIYMYISALYIPTCTYLSFSLTYYEDTYMHSPELRRVPFMTWARTDCTGGRYPAFLPIAEKGEAYGAKGGVVEER